MKNGNKTNRLIKVILLYNLLIILILGTVISIAAYNIGKIRGIKDCCNVNYTCFDK